MTTAQLESASLHNAKIKAHVEIFTSFQQFTRLLTEVAHSKERSKEINDSILADMLGDSPLPNSPSSTSQSIIEMMHRFIELQQTMYRFPTILKMIGRHPWGTHIEKSQHLENCFHLLCNECYILEERLKRFFSATNRCAAEFGHANVPKPAVSAILRTHKEMLGRYVSMRGQHVHQTHLVPREIARIGLIETFMKTDFLEEQMPVLHRLAINDARRIWRKNAKTIDAVATLLVARALATTEYVWRPSIEAALRAHKA